MLPVRPAAVLPTVILIVVMGFPAALPVAEASSCNPDGSSTTASFTPADVVTTSTSTQRSVQTGSSSDNFHCVQLIVNEGAANLGRYVIEVFDPGNTLRFRWDHNGLSEIPELTPLPLAYCTLFVNHADCTEQAFSGGVLQGGSWRVKLTRCSALTATNAGPLSTGPCGSSVLGLATIGQGWLVSVSDLSVRLDFQRL